MIDRRTWLQRIGWGALGCTASPWLPALAAHLAEAPTRRRQCVLLWMAGGPSQMDTFDMKPGHEHGGEFKEQQTRVPGMQFSEHLPKLAEYADRLSIVRSVSTKEGDHGRGTYLMRTGQRPMGPVRHPSIGASLSKELQDASGKTPGYVSIAPYRLFNPAAFGPGFLGPQYAPLTVAATDNVPRPAAMNDMYASLPVDNLVTAEGIDAARQRRRVAIWRQLQDRFLDQRGTHVSRSHDMAYQQALELMTSPVADAFHLEEETDTVREAYGAGRFGQGCLMARRLLERDVPFVEVSLGSLSENTFGWDTHQNNFPAVRRLSEELDRGWATLMRELDDRGMLETTTILWMGEFGRTPKINGQAGRDHFPAAWSCVFAGGGIQGGSVYGRTSPDGTSVEEDPVAEGDVLATLAAAVGVDPSRENITPQGRPVKIADGRVLPFVDSTR